MKVRWAESAEADLDALTLHIAVDGVQNALRIQERLLEAANGLSDFPLQGRLGRIPETRELVVTGTPYLEVYAILDDAVWILHVVHGAHDWPPEFD